ncbi:NADH-cytochrome b5 reductase 1 [Bonamia ostreae]|uniref:NADH-cytochrome b5 reductase 1 n=1 Tax=Bonamia ostreae TaxID=126728 RepID=A0ABV2ASY6_9EUKA
MALTYFIAGASRGIGFEFAKQLLASQNNVIAGCRKIESLRSLKSKYPENLLTLTLDVNSDSSIDSAYEDLKSRGIKNLKIDVFIQNAGVADFGDKVFDVTRETAKHVLETNSISPLMVSRKFLDMFAKPASNWCLLRLEWVRYLKTQVLPLFFTE